MEIYNDFVKEVLDSDNQVYVLPKFDCINATLFKRGNQLSVYSNNTNQSEFFPDLSDIANQIDTKNTILQVGVLELDMNGESKDREDMEWFYNGRLQPDGVRIIVQDCYYTDGDVLVNESFKKRFQKVEEIIPYQERVGIYEILPLPSEKIENNSNPAEFQAILDWITQLDVVSSQGAIVRDSSSTVFDDKEKVI